jgi:ribosomal protein L37AE/L43A
MIELKDIPKDIFTASRLIIEQSSEMDKLKNQVRYLEAKMMLGGICPFCDYLPPKIIKEEGNELYFCEHCKSMMFENISGGYETRKAHRVK